MTTKTEIKETTRALYLEDSYLKDCKAVVTNVTGRKVELSQTVLNPHGDEVAHPQPHDKGTLVLGRKLLSVSKTILEGDRILHHVKEKPPPIGAEVGCYLDWARRYRIMRNHTAMHIMTHLALEICGGRINSNLECRDHITHIDLRECDTSDVLAKQVEREANIIIQEDRPIELFYVSRKEVNNYVDPRKAECLIIPNHVDKVRFVAIKDFCADICYGTVLRSTREIGCIRILAKHNKFFEEKAGGNKRLAFVVS
ncbi:MAG: alanyl-tRNA editing protein [candidate division Zixibacteria bacterium]|nr:alanyl-tRNA editing protein [candidate division Zixibacteria bacterium]